MQARSSVVGTLPFAQEKIGRVPQISRRPLPTSQRKDAAKLLARSSASMRHSATVACRRALAQGDIIGGPIRHSVPLLRDVMTAILVRFEGYGDCPRSGTGPPPIPPTPRRLTTDPCNKAPRTVLWVQQTFAKAICGHYLQGRTDASCLHRARFGRAQLYLQNCESCGRRIRTLGPP
jgi:hypothetical protein